MIVRSLVPALAALAALLPASASAQDLFYSPFTNNFSNAEKAQIQAGFQQAQRAITNAIFYLRGNGSSNLRGEHPAFNRFFGPIYDQTGTSPLAGTPQFNQHQQNLTTNYRVVRQEIIGEGLGTGTNFTFAPRPVYLGTPVVGDRVYVTPRDRLYPDPLRFPTYGSFLTTGVATSTAGGTNNQTLLLNTITWTRPVGPYPTYDPFNDGILEVVRPIVGTSTTLDAVRYNQLVTIMEKVQFALQNVTFEVRNDLNSTLIMNNTAQRFFNPNPNPLLRENVGLNGFGAFDRRGFEQYGLSTSGNGGDWIDDPNFFTDKFGVLAQDDSFNLPNLSLNQTFANIWIGQSALNGVETAQNGLFDGTDRSGQTQASDPLHVQILEAVIAMVSLGLQEQDFFNGNASNFGLPNFNEAPTFNRDIFNALNGNPNQDTFTGDFFPGDLDIKNLSAFLQDTVPIQQGGSANATAGPPPGKQAIAGNAFTNNGQNAGFGNNIIIPLP